MKQDAPESGPDGVVEQEAVRLNLGSGDQDIKGYRNLDGKNGDEIYPLSTIDDASCEEVRASHVLEHFSHREIQRVINEWARVLKPGGVLKIAVPDFELCARSYLAGEKMPIESFVMGAHADGYDHHGALFDHETLGDYLRAAGLIGISRWKSDLQDCASLPISLNLQAEKPPTKMPTVAAVMSMPRLAFTDNYFSAFEGLAVLGIPLRKTTGAFWGQCLTRGIEEIIKDKPELDYVLTLDYDTIFTRDDVVSLLALAAKHPEADAIAPIQSHRTKPEPLFTIRRDGKMVSGVTFDTFDGDLLDVSSAHFGLTLLSVEKLRKVQKPWFMSTPDTDGRWGDARTDEDIHFWRNWRLAGNTLYVATRVPVGHAELMIRWPSRTLAATHQHPSDFWKTGKPDDVWR